MRKQKLARISFFVFSALILFSGAIAICDSPARSPGHSQLSGELKPIEDLAASKKWDKQALLGVEAADSLDTLKGALALCDEGGIALDRGNQRWDEFIHREVDKAETIPTITLAWKRSRDHSEGERYALAKVDSICLREAQKTKTLDEVIAAGALDGSPARKLLSLKQRDLSLEAMLKAKNLDACADAFEKSLKDDEAKELMRKCWDKLAMDEARNANTFAQILSTFDRTRHGSEARELLIRKAAKFLPDK
jgi:hypothetical protein